MTSWAYKRIRVRGWVFDHPCLCLLFWVALCSAVGWWIGAAAEPYVKQMTDGEALVLLVIVLLLVWR